MNINYLNYHVLFHIFDYLDILDIIACSEANEHLLTGSQLYLERAEFQTLTISSTVIMKLQKNRTISALDAIETILKHTGSNIMNLSVDLSAYDNEGIHILDAVKNYCNNCKHYKLTNGLKIEDWSNIVPVFTELQSCTITKCSDALSDDIMCKLLNPSANTLTTLSLDNILSITGTFLHSLLKLKKLSIKVSNHDPYEHQTLFDNIKEYLQKNNGLNELELCNSGPNNVSSLFPHMDNLQKLHLQGFTLNNDPDFVKIACLPNLTSLSLSLFHSTEIIASDEFAGVILSLSKVNRLTELNIHLSYRQKLEFTSTVVNSFRFTNLKKFSLRAPLMQRIPFDSIYGHLGSSAQNLIRLHVDIFRVNIAQISSNLYNLQHLSINCFHLMGLDGPVILALKELIRFDLYIWPKSPPKLKQLLNALRADKLEVINITVPKGTALTPETIQILQKFPKLRCLTILGGIWNDDCFIELSRCKQITELVCNNIDDPKRVIFGGMNSFMENSKSLRRLSILECSESFKSYFENMTIRSNLEVDLQLAERKAISF